MTKYDIGKWKKQKILKTNKNILTLVKM